ncbi:DUF3153 domain-containing protein [Pannus brasiliensis CCIBt3594]|uniref:DUF3153 domain-containing protein n=1 Tax=Pannus brasiliensis CCIBt3594 TaxID=1427578 RepID=A0AAW9QY36_9CHRO
MNSPTDRKKAKRFFLLPLLCGLFVLLTGCVRYDVGVNFSHQHHGEIVQDITLGQRLTSLSQTEATKWLHSLEDRAKSLGGKAKRVSDRETIVTIPFGNGQELEEKFNRFFNPGATDAIRRSTPDDLKLLQLDSRLSIDQSNWFLLDRDRLTLTVDLRALGVLSEKGNIIVSPGSLVNIDFALNTPFGGRIITGETALPPDVEQDGTRIVWHLKPGEINRIEAVFWVPSYLAIGSIAIIALAIAGYVLKYRQFPGVSGPDRTLPEM